MDRNQITIVGRIGNRIKKAKTVNGDDYIWMPIYIENRAASDSTENNQTQGINVMCYKPQVIKYLERVKAHAGNTVVVFGFVSAFKTEINGKEIVAHAINGNEIYVVKTKADKEEVQTNNN